MRACRAARAGARAAAEAGQFDAEGATMITEEEVERAVIEAFRAVFRKWKREEK